MVNRFLLSFLLCLAAIWPLSAESDGGYDGKVRRLDIINWTHTDYGFTDNPVILLELQKRYIDIVIEYAERSAKNQEGERFTWTVEALDPLWQWWQEASDSSRKRFLKAVDRGQIDVNIMPFNIHPCYNDIEIDQLLNWIPDELARRLKIGVAIQNDVNGFPRAAARKLREKGVNYIWLGMNGHHPFPKPNLSKWNLGDGDEIWLWNGGPYWDAFDYFSESKWRTWQCEASDLMYRWPREGEIFKSDEASVKKAHEICVKKLQSVEKKGYAHSVLPITFSNQWRCDNDGPFYGIVEFVKTWNRLGLEPELRLSTATASMKEFTAKETPDCTVSGEFGDWWAFGLTALPREHTAAREARWMLQAARSDVFGEMNAAHQKRAEQVNRDICTFYEHTFASMSSAKRPYEEFNQGSIVESNRYAYEAYEWAKWMLAQRARTALIGQEAGVQVFNTQDAPYSGWIEFDFISLRHPGAASVRNESTGKSYPIYKIGTSGRFWVDNLPPKSRTLYVLSSDQVSSEETAAPEMEFDASGWPVSVIWPGMKYPLYDGQAGMLRPCSMVSGGWWAGDAVLQENFPGGYAVEREDTPYSVIFTQKLFSPLVNSASRQIEIYKGEPRAHVKVVYDRVLHPERTPEMFYVDFPMPDAGRDIKTSNGGAVFTPYRDHVQNTCTSFYVCDSWVSYEQEDGCRVWSSSTSPVVCFGTTSFYKKSPEPENTNLLLSMVYNNAWGVNFPMEYSGDVVCEYDLYWTPERFNEKEIRKTTDSYLVKPVYVRNDRAAEDDSYRRWLNGEEL